MDTTADLLINEVVDSILLETENKILKATGIKVVLYVEPITCLNVNSADKFLKQLICKIYNVRWADIICNRRKGDMILPRHIYCYIAKKYFNFTYEKIGEKLGGRDHTTAIHAVRKIEGFYHIKDSECKVIDNIIRALVRFQTERKKDELAILDVEIDLKEKELPTRSGKQILTPEQLGITQNKPNYRTLGITEPTTPTDQLSTDIEPEIKPKRKGRDYRLPITRYKIA